MFKKFFIAFILGLLVMTSQIAAAAVDWNSAPRINSKAQLFRYIEEGRRNVKNGHPLGQTIFYFIFPSVKTHNQQELVKFVGEISTLVVVPGDPNNENKFCAWIEESGGYGTGRFIYHITKDYPGTHVANAYMSENQHQAWLDLNYEERLLYSEALKIVSEANKRSSEREKAEYIHDEICKCVKEWKSHTNENAIGALIKKVTNCQGYTDAFYMLGRMAGLNVGRINGTFQGDPHTWNWITFRDGKSYFIDVTGDDNNDEGYSHDYFIKNKVQMEKTHQCEWSIIPNLQ